MNKELNLVEILKDCPKETKLYCTLFGDVKFVGVNDDNADYPINIRCPNGGVMGIAFNGRYCAILDGECILFPSKENRDWSTFKVPVKRFKVPVKRFKVAEFQPFDKVLCRDLNTSVWHCNFFSDIVYPVGCAPYVYTTGLVSHYHCIPFNDETKHLVGSRDDCPDYYKWWEE